MIRPEALDIVEETDAAAARRGARHIHPAACLQGGGFCPKPGYDVDGVPDGFPPGHRRTWLK